MPHLQFFMFDSHVHDRGLHLSTVIMTLLFSYQFKSFISILVILSLCWGLFHMISFSWSTQYSYACAMCWISLGPWDTFLFQWSAIGFIFVGVES